jgi:hypothetical protein
MLDKYPTGEYTTPVSTKRDPASIPVTSQLSSPSSSSPSSTSSSPPPLAGSGSLHRALFKREQSKRRQRQSRQRADEQRRHRQACEEERATSPEAFEQHGRRATEDDALLSGGRHNEIYEARAHVSVVLSPTDREVIVQRIGVEIARLRRLVDTLARLARRGRAWRRVHSDEGGGGGGGFAPGGAAAMMALRDAHVRRVRVAARDSRVCTRVIQRLLWSLQCIEPSSTMSASASASASFAANARAGDAAGGGHTTTADAADALRCTEHRTLKRVFTFLLSELTAVLRMTSADEHQRVHVSTYSVSGGDADALVSSGTDCRDDVADNDNDDDAVASAVVAIDVKHEQPHSKRPRQRQSPPSQRRQAHGGHDALLALHGDIDGGDMVERHVTVHLDDIGMLGVKMRVQNDDPPLAPLSHTSLRSAVQLPDNAAYTDDLRLLEADCITVAEMYHDLSELVTQHGAAIDTIESSVMRTNVSALEAYESLAKADEYSRKKRKWICVFVGIFLLVVLVVAAWIVAVYKS